MVCRTVSTLPIVERLAASWMMGHPLLRPWLHAGSVALLLCLGRLLGASRRRLLPGFKRLQESTRNQQK